jgi:hypothetical protein
MSFTGMSYKQHQGLQEWIASKLVMLMIWVVCNDYKLHVFGKLANCQGTMFPTVLGKNMMQTECCISRCDNLTKKEQDKPSCNTGKQVSSKNITVASVKLVQHLPIKIKETNCNIGRNQSIPVGNADYKMTNGRHQSWLIASTWSKRRMQWRVPWRNHHNSMRPENLVQSTKCTQHFIGPTMVHELNQCHSQENGNT